MTSSEQRARDHHRRLAQIRTLVAQIVVPYVIFSVLWILGSDALLAALAPSVEAERMLQSAKGVLFVCLSGLLIGFLIRRQLRLRAASDRRVATAEAVLGAMFENAAVGLGLLAPDGRWLRANPHLCALVGLPESELLELRLADLALPEAGDAMLANARDVLRRGEPALTVESPLNRHDGGARWGRLTLSLVHGLPGNEELFVLILEDITDRRDAEADLRERSHQLQLALAATKLAIWDWRPASGELRLSPEIEQQIGYTPESLEHDFHRWTELIDECQRDAFLRSVNAALRPGYRAQWELRMRHRSGRAVWIQLRVEVTGHHDDLRVVGAHHDITERKEADLRLRESERRYRLYFEQSPVPMWTYDKQSLRFTSVNDAALRAYGYARPEFLAMTIEDIRPDEDIAPLRRMLRQDNSFDHGVWRHRRKSGDLALVEVSSFDLPEENGVEQRLVLAIEVTEKYRTEHRLRRYSSRLKRLSQRLLSAQENERRRIALELHDHVGQTLTAAQLDLDALGDCPGEAPPPATLARLREAVSMVLEQVRSMTLDLQPPVLKDLGLPAAIRWIIKRQSPHSPFTITLEDAVHPEHVPLDIAMACFRIVQESLTNATRHSEASEVRIELAERNEQLHCTISDDGIGFDYQGGAGGEQGWGLGLFGIEERAQLVGGWARIDSRPGEGTRIEVRLPLHDDFVQLQQEA